MDSQLKHGIFTVSLDFEIHWGVSENRTVESYRENLSNVPEVIGGLLDSFTQYGVHATWATVGMLMCKNREEVTQSVSVENRPDYVNKKLSNYNILNELGDDEQDDPFHYGLSLCRKN